MSQDKYVLWFKDVDKGDIALVGGKGANLGEMTQAGFPVPPGFIITAQAYYHFLAENDLRPRIKNILKTLNPNDARSLLATSKAVKKIILESEIPKDVAVKIVEYYHDLNLFKHAAHKKENLSAKLKSIFTESFVAVRSSATAEDLPQASFAGQQETYLNVKGDVNLLHKVRACWASLFEPRAIFYRSEQKFDHFKIGIAVPVQKMVQSDTSGVMFTIEPTTSDKNKLVIEAIYGLGEFIVQGIETPDQYIIDKHTGELVFKHFSHQERMLVKEGNKNVIYKVPQTHRGIQKITSKQIYELALLGKKLERHYYFPQDIEWAIEGRQIYIVQTRPITTIGKKDTANIPIEKKQPLLQGVSASPGIVTGPVRILQKSSEIHKIKPGDILVASQTNPDFVPAMRKAVAVVTEKGGRTSHAAIVSRELGIPAVVGVTDILKTVRDGDILTIDGTKGTVYRGNIITPQIKGHNLTVPLLENSSTPAQNYHIKTATKVYINLAEADKAAEYAKLPVDGVGLLRAEFMIANIGYHPKKLIHEKRQQLFIDKLTEGIATICKAFNPRPVVYRATDFKTNEYANLKGGREYEPIEPNPMLGYRGAYRYINDPQVFELELKAIKNVRNKLGLKNLSLMIPFVRTVEELVKVKKILSSNNLTHTPSFKLWMMVEIPSNVILLDQFIDCGIDGVSVGSNDLTMLILGTDRDNSEIAPEFNEKNAAVLWALEKIVATCHKRKITSSICGQAASDYPDLVEKLVNWGVTSISVNPDAAVTTRSTISQAEEKLIKSR